MSRVMRFILGSEELPPTRENPEPGTEAHGSVTGKSDAISDNTDYVETTTPGDISNRRHLPVIVKKLIESLEKRLSPKHRLCQHNSGCFTNSFKSGARLFVIGYAVQAAIKLLKSLKMMFQKPRVLIDAMIHKDHLKLGLFLGSLTSLARISHCLLRWIRNEDHPVHGLLSGFVAGWSMMWYKSSSVVMWLTSKLAEILYMKGADSGLLPYIRHGDIIVYTLSTAFIIHTAVFEPHNLRPTYWRFLLNLTDQKLGLMNRKLFDAFGTKSSTLNPSYWPDYDSRFTPHL